MTFLNLYIAIQYTIIPFPDFAADCGEFVVNNRVVAFCQTLFNCLKFYIFFRITLFETNISLALQVLLYVICFLKAWLYPPIMSNRVHTAYIIQRIVCM